MPRVIVLARGGTIASRFSPRDGALIAGVSGEELVHGLSGFGSSVEITTEQFCNIGSFLLTLDRAFRIVRRVEELLQAVDVAGVVVTCGRDTMEEIAYLADLLITSDKPVVFTGAQRHVGYLDSDGLRNLNAAILVSASEASKASAP